MIQTLTGDNDFEIRQELDSIKQSLASSNPDLDSLSLNGDDITLEELKQQLSSYSLFSTNRLITLYMFSKVKGIDSIISQLDDLMPESTSLVLIEPTLDKRTSLYKELVKNTDFKQKNKPSLIALVKWLKEYVRDQGGTISDSDGQYLIERAGDDQFLLSQEVNKLIIYAPNIIRETIELLNERSPSSTVFELLEAAFSQHTVKAIAVYDEQRLLRVEPEQILAMLSWQLNALALYMTSTKLSPKEVYAKSGMSPFSLSKAKQIASKLSYSNLKELVSDLSELDLKSKTSSLDLDEGLKNFIVGLGY